MTFISFTNSLLSELQSELPGAAAHKKMAPYDRLIPIDLDRLKITPKESAVLILFYPVNEAPHFCLIKRPEYDGIHSGQVCFPGGRKDDVDVDLKQTALRETNEEIGVDTNTVHLLGELTQVYVPPSNFLITPYAGYCLDTPRFIPDKTEVNEVIDVPVGQFLDESIVKRKMIAVGRQGMNIDAPYFDIADKTVWGATAVMLAEVKELIKRFYI